MKKMVRWAIDNGPAMNTLLVCVLAVGAICFTIMRREIFPNFQLEIALVSVPYPGATPDEIEKSVCQRIEEAVSGVDGLKKITTVAQENVGYAIIELQPGVPVQETVDKLRAQVDAIKSRLPQNTEPSSVQAITFKSTAIRVALLAPPRSESSLTDEEQEKELRELTEEIRNEIFALRPVKAKNFMRNIFAPLIVPSGKSVVSDIGITGEKEDQITVEVSEDTLKQYNTSLSAIAQVVRSENQDTPAGKMKSASQEILIRAQNKRRAGEAIADLQIMNQNTGDTVRLGEIAKITDGFEEASLLHFINQRPATEIAVNRTSNEDLFTIVNAVEKYVADKEVPDGYELHTWADTSVPVRDRIDLLVRNGFQGLILVFIVLALFLELRLAFWVAMGIPVSMLGAGIVLYYSGQTINMLSLFSFLMALGIVVDDAIVIGENIYSKREEGMGFFQSAIEGTVEVIPSVTASIATTVIAFMPLLFVSGIMGKFIAVMPLAVIAMLVISLIESVIILPCHLAHKDNLFISVMSTVLYVFYPVVWVAEKLRQFCDKSIRWVINGPYTGLLNVMMNHPMMALSTALSMLILMGGVIAGGFVPVTGFPKIDAQVIEATIAFQDGTAEGFSKEAAEKIEKALYEVQAEIKETENEDVLKTVYRRLGSQGNNLGGPTGITSGSHVANIVVELTPVGERTISSEKIKNLWREKVGVIPGSEVLKFGSQSMGPSGVSIEFKLLADGKHAKTLEKYAERCKDYLRKKAGVFDVEDDSRPGKVEYRFRVNDAGKSVGVTQTDISNALRNSYYGVEVQRLQIGRREFKVMVRLPEGEREYLSSFDEIMVDDSQGNRRPLNSVASLALSESPSEINRLNRNRSITVSADTDASKPGLGREIKEDLEKFFIPNLQQDFRNETGSGLIIDWEGDAQQTQEAFSSMFIGLGIALLAMYALLTMQFQSYIQPMIIMAIIPFGFIGAVLGHWVLNQELTLFSFFGFVALTGVIVNDSIVLVDFINRYVRQGGDLQEAVVLAGKKRFRAVTLTSMTTVAGLIPILQETSLQAQVLIPMAVSLTFGLMFGTILILLLVPVFYRTLSRVVDFFGFDSIHDIGKHKEESDNFNESPAPAGSLAMQGDS